MNRVCHLTSCNVQILRSTWVRTLGPGDAEAIDDDTPCNGFINCFLLTVKKSVICMIITFYSQSDMPPGKLGLSLILL